MLALFYPIDSVEMAPSATVTAKAKHPSWTKDGATPSAGGPTKVRPNGTESNVVDGLTPATNSLPKKIHRMPMHTQTIQTVLLTFLCPYSTHPTRLPLCAPLALASAVLHWPSPSALPPMGIAISCQSSITLTYGARWSAWP